MMTQELCDETFSNFNYSAELEYCKHVFDMELCWPPTPAGTNVSKFCPRKKGTNPLHFAYRICGTDGNWDYNNKTHMKEKGYTYYDDCFLPRLRDLINMCTEMDFDKCLQIAHKTRLIEMVGLGISLISLVVSLFIFCRYRAAAPPEGGYFCEAAYTLLEYAKTAMFMWMFIEGLYLHNVITFTVFQEHSYMKLYFWIGWCVPIFMTSIWAAIMAAETTNTGCWYLYYFLPYYWILEGPRCGVLIVNLIFLLNVIRVLIAKLRKSRTSEIEQLRKAVRAAIFLLPLMGTANILFLVDFRLFKKSWQFAVWSYSTYFITTFQGFFIAILYCFLNGEVRTAVKNSFTVYRSLRINNCPPTRNSTVLSGIAAFEPEQLPKKQNEKVACCYCCFKNNNCDTQKKANKMHE